MPDNDNVATAAIAANDSADSYPSPNAGQWVFSHTTHKDSGLSANNHNTYYSNLCEASSPDGKWCADIVTITFSLQGDPPVPKRRFKQLTNSEIERSTRVIEGPQTHWAFVDATYSEDLRRVDVRVKGFTHPQRWRTTLIVEEYQET